mgnify:CR=1 FL=1
MSKREDVCSNCGAQPPDELPDDTKAIHNCQSRDWFPLERLPRPEVAQLATWASDAELEHVHGLSPEEITALRLAFGRVRMSGER